MTVRSQEVEPGVVRLSMSNWRGRAVGYTVSAYVMRGVLVDTGFPGVRAELLDAVRHLELRGVIVTHWHEDHSGNAPGLASIGLPLRMHEECEATLRARPDIGAYRRIVWGRAPRLVAPLTPFDPSPLEVIATPGHTPDHLVVWDAERGVLASGDLFLGVKVRVAHLHESPSLVVRSLRTVLALEPRLLLDAHRGPLASPTSLLRAKIDWMEETIGEIGALADRGLSQREIRRRVLGREDFVGHVSFGEYSKRAFVHAVLADEWMAF